MSIRLSPALLEATRLTRAGRLAEATALLKQGLFEFTPARPGGDRQAAEPQRRPDALDMSPPPAGGGAWTAGQAERPADLGASKGAAGLGLILDRLKQPAARQRRAPILDVPAGAQFAARIYAGPSGSRPYKLYIPSGHAAGEPLPLVVMLHGCTQTPDDFAAGTRMNALAEEGPFLVAYPAQTKAANASRCWNWFDAAEQRRDGAEASSIAGITREVMAEFGVDPRRVYVAGLSAGGAAAAIMGAAFPDLYAAVGVHSGLACGAARDMPSAFAAMRNGARHSRSGAGISTPPTIVFHGDGDTTVHPINGGQVVEQAIENAGELSLTVTRGSSSGGIAYTCTTQCDDRGIVSELWLLHGAGHAWSGGSPDGSFTDPRGPDASRAMVRFFEAASAARAKDER